MNNSPFLTEPVTEHLKCENVKLHGLEIGHASMQGLRVSMEDEHIIDGINSTKDHALVAIMDGKAAPHVVLQMQSLYLTSISYTRSCWYLRRQVHLH